MRFDILKTLEVSSVNDRACASKYIFAAPEEIHRQMTANANRVTGSDPSVTDYILEAPAKCPNCRREIGKRRLWSLNSGPLSQSSFSLVRRLLGMGLRLCPLRRTAEHQTSTGEGLDRILKARRLRCQYVRAEAKHAIMMAKNVWTSRMWSFRVHTARCS